MVALAARVLFLHGHAAMHLSVHPLLQPGQNFLRRLESEILQEKGHVLNIGFDVLGRANNQRRRHKILALQADVGMHPVGSRPRPEIVVIDAARFQRRLRDVGDSVLLIGWNLSMPMHQRRLGNIVLQRHAKRLTGAEGQTLLSTGAGNPPNPRRAAFNIEGARAHAKGVLIQKPGRRKGPRNRRRPDGNRRFEKTPPVQFHNDLRPKRTLPRSLSSPERETSNL
jgi:hypothetical protein